MFRLAPGSLHSLRNALALARAWNAFLSSTAAKPSLPCSTASATSASTSCSTWVCSTGKAFQLQLQANISRLHGRVTLFGTTASAHSHCIGMFMGFFRNNTHHQAPAVNVGDTVPHMCEGLNL